MFMKRKSTYTYIILSNMAWRYANSISLVNDDVAGRGEVREATNYYESNAEVKFRALRYLV